MVVLLWAGTLFRLVTNYKLRTN